MIVSPQKTPLTFMDINMLIMVWIYPSRGFWVWNRVADHILRDGKRLHAIDLGGLRSFSMRIGSEIMVEIAHVSYKLVIFRIYDM